MENTKPIKGLLPAPKIPNYGKSLLEEEFRMISIICSMLAIKEEYFFGKPKTS